MEWHILFDDPLSAIVTSFPAFVTLFLNIPFTSEKAAGTISIKKPQVLTKKQEIQLFYFMVYSFHVSFITSKFCSDFMIRMISSILSFETNKVNPFPTLRASTPLLAIASPHLFFFQIYVMQTKLIQSLIQAKYLQQKEQQGLLVLFYLNYLLHYQEILLMVFLRQLTFTKFYIS